jgi:hydrogenase/urease accessory protein HupE
LAIAALAALLRGLMNGSAARAADGTWLSVTGVAVGVLVLVVLFSGLGAWLVRRRYEVVLRVAGSWVAAISLLVLGWRLRA